MDLISIKYISAKNWEQLLLHQEKENQLQINWSKSPANHRQRNNNNKEKNLLFQSNTTLFYFLRNLYQKVVSACITLVEIFQIFSFIKFFGIYSIKCLYQRVCTLVSWHHFGRDICKSLFKRKHLFYSCYFYFWDINSESNKLF